MKKQILTSTRDFVTHLDRHSEVWHFEDEIDPNLELAIVQREVSKRKGPAILFENVKGTKFPVATNLYGSTRRMELAFGQDPFKFIEGVAHTALNIMPPTFKKILDLKPLGLQALKIGLKKKNQGAVQDVNISPVDIMQLPQIKSWPEDGGAFVTLPLVYTESPSTGKGNLGMYRVQLFDKDTCGMHIQIHRGGGFHYHEATQMGQALPARLLIGGPPALTIAAVAPLPEDIPELIFASLLMGKKLETTTDQLGIQLAAEADFAVSGVIQPKLTKPEGPFGDHYGYYSLQHDYPYLQVQSFTHRRGAIYPATVVGRPPQEDHYIAEFLQEILEPLFPLVMSNVKKVWAYEESGVHSLAGAVVKNRYHKEAYTAALRILSEGHLSLTKFLILTDQDVNLRDFRELLTTVLERADLRTDLFVMSNISQDTLDYTGPKVNEGSKAILMGLGEKKRELHDKLPETLHHKSLKNPKLFCPGVLCVEADSYEMYPNQVAELLEEPAFHQYQMVCIVDDANEAAKSNEDFIWHIFTRFEPAADIYGKQDVNRFHVGIEGPMVIDCRLKPWYPGVLVDDPDVYARVMNKWGAKIDQMCKKG